MSNIDFTEFVPVREESVDDVIARMDADVNAGLDPDDSAFLDTTEGGFYADLRNMSALEFERLYDFVSTEVVASMFLGLTFGEYLDGWGVTLGVPRKDEVKATGEVTFTGTDGALIATGTEIATPQTDPDADPVSFVTTGSGTITGGTLTLAIAATEAGAQGNVASGSVSVLLSPLGDEVSAVNNAEATTGGADVENDDQYRSRLLLEFGVGQGAGTQADYERWALTHGSVGFATVEPIWSGPGTVRVIITDQQNNPVSGTVITELQNDLDPVPERGEGRAPIGAIVTVATPTLLTVDVAATIVPVSGYSLDGAGGTIPLESDIETAIRDYIDRLRPGDDVVREKVSAQLFTVQGVYDVTAVTLNGGTTNVAVGALEVPRTGTVTLS